MAALPAEGLRLGPRLEDQLHALGGALARLRWVEAEGQIFVGRPAQQPDDEATLRQIVEHCQFLGDLHRLLCETIGPSTAIFIFFDRAAMYDAETAVFGVKMRGE